MSTELKPYTRCRVCDSGNLTELFTLGEQYVSDFIPEDKVHSGHKVPITLDLCPRCNLVQQRYTAPQDFLYTRHYWYRSGVTDSMKSQLYRVAECAAHAVELSHGDIVLDIGSNDGTLLRCYDDIAPGLIKVGVEPATNLAEVGSRGIDHFIPEFWSAEKFDDAMSYNLAMSNSRETKAKIVTACGMFYDLDNPNQFIADIQKVLHPEGIFVAQLMCLKQTLEKYDVGNLAHEHLEFYSLRSLTELMMQNGLRIFDIEENDVNGGSYRLYCCHWEASFPQSESVQRYRNIECQMELQYPETYRHWYERVSVNALAVEAFIRNEREKGKRTWVYGASTKGNVILQYANIDHKLIDEAADRSPEKWGKYAVGTGIKITSEDEFRRANPEYALVLPYAFLDEFIEREKEWRDRGGKFIVPIPELKIV